MKDEPGTTLVIGVGNHDRGDDAVGLAVAERVRAAAPRGVSVLTLEGDQLALLDAWADATDVYVIDAVCSGGRPGSVFHFDATRPLPARFGHRGSHTFSLADVVELARALGTLPPHVTGYGIEGNRFDVGAPLSPETCQAIEDVAGSLLRELDAPRTRPQRNSGMESGMCLGTVGVITEITDGMAVIDAGGVLVTASLLTCPEAVTGQTVLAHSGYVLEIIEEEPS